MTCTAMHMANELLSIPVAAATGIIAMIVLAATVRTVKTDVTDHRLPLMGVMGAFVFAAQMINFTLPGMPGTSGHLGGAVLLAILLGPGSAIVTMAAILIIQCLLFQDGGLLALGCNIINMGVVPALVGYGLYRLILGPAAHAAAWRQYLAAWASCIIGVTCGAAFVPIQAYASGVLQIPAEQFLGVMVGTHLIIGCIEGAITFAVIVYLRQIRPDVVGLKAKHSHTGQIGYGVVAASILITALLLGGVVQWFASTHPDGLEWSYLEHSYNNTKQTINNPSPTIATVDNFQSKWSPLSDYTLRLAPLGQIPAEPDPAEEKQAITYAAVDGYSSLAGVAGTLITLCVLWIASRLINRPQPVG